MKKPSPEDIAHKSAFGKRLESLVVGSKGEFAEKIGISRTQLSNLLSGRTPPSRLLLKRLADICGISESWLATGEGLREANGRDGHSAISGETWHEVSRTRIGDVEVIIRHRTGVARPPE